MGTEIFRGKTIEGALAVTDSQIVEALGGLPERKLVCSLLAVSALRAAIEDLRKRTGP